MIVYITLFAITLFFSLVFDSGKEKASSFIFIGYSLLIGSFVGFGDMLGGYDRYIYCEVFDSYADQLNVGKGMFNEIWNLYFKIEPGYGLLNYIIAKVTSNRYIFIFIFTLVAYFLFAKSIYNNTRNPFFCLLIFLGLCFFFSFTYIRQIMAMAILWNTIPFIENKKPIHFFLVVLFAASIHNAALYFSIIYFIPIKNYSVKTILIVMALLLIIGIIGPFNFLFEAYGNLADASRKAELYKQTSEYGFRFEYLLESIVFLGILLFNYDNIIFNRKNAIHVNMYLMFCGTLLLFVKSSDGGRMSWLFAIGIILVLSKLIENNNKPALSFFIVTLCFILYFRILVSWGILVSPYKTFFTNGYREGDYIHSIYEYDAQYDIDKFYR